MPGINGLPSTFGMPPMTFRPTLIERAYQLADSGDYALVREVKLKLPSEGFNSMEIATRLHGQTVTTDSMQRCKARF